MTYEELKEVIEKFLSGKLSRVELMAAWGLWERKETGVIPEWKGGGVVC